VHDVPITVVHARVRSTMCARLAGRPLEQLQARTETLSIDN